MTYDYKCTVCGAVFEVQHSMKEEPSITCECGAPAKKQLCATFGVKYKGLGFYSTDKKAEAAIGKDRLHKLQHEGK